MLQAPVHHGVLKGVCRQHGGIKIGRHHDRISAGGHSAGHSGQDPARVGRTREQARSTVARATKQVEEVFSEALARISLQDLSASDMRNTGE